MAKVLCNMTGCKYCGRKSKKYQTEYGEPLYYCKRAKLQIYKSSDCDNNKFSKEIILHQCILTIINDKNYNENNAISYSDFIKSVNENKELYKYFDKEVKKKDEK